MEKREEQMSLKFSLKCLRAVLYVHHNAIIINNASSPPKSGRRCLLYPASRESRRSVMLCLLSLPPTRRHVAMLQAQSTFLLQ